jgi:hypothetical protein
VSYLTIIVVLFKAIGFLIDHLEKTKLLDAQAKSLLADHLLELSKKSKAVQDVKARIDAMSDGDVDRRLHERGDFRD